MKRVKEKIVADSLYYTATIEYKNEIYNLSAAWFTGEVKDHFDWFITSDHPEAMEILDPDDKTELEEFAQSMFEYSGMVDTWDHIQTEKKYN